MTSNYNAIIGFLILIIVAVNINGFTIQQQKRQQHQSRILNKQQQHQHYATTDNQDDTRLSCQPNNRQQSINVNKNKNNNNGTTRRKTFGDMIGSILFPTIVASTTTAATVSLPNAAVAGASPPPLIPGDEYAFKATVQKLADAFPEAVPNSDLIKKVTKRLNKYKYDEATLVAFSLCADEVNRPLEDTFYGYYGEHFNMGGLAGFPFAGVTGFGAMAAHIPDNGSCLMVYGPHVGIDKDGNVGKINRKGKGKAGSCCGSAVAASKYITAVYEGKADTVGPPTDSVDAQQNYVSAALLPYGEAVTTAKDPMIELPFACFEPIDTMMSKIVSKAGKGVKDGKIAMLGGLQINTPRGMSDYFLPLRFDIRNSNNEIIEDLLWVRKPGSEARGKA